MFEIYVQTFQALGATSPGKLSDGGKDSWVNGKLIPLPGGRVANISMVSMLPAPRPSHEHHSFHASCVMICVSMLATFG